ncbi:MAG: hypothetical protein KDK70_39975, partial [Myxococcales bacterium]|nr:hypothetical protein [Myxococcales bacterium]
MSIIFSSVCSSSIIVVLVMGRGPGCVVVAATDVVVVDGKRELWVVVLERHAVHSVLKDRDDTPTSRSAYRQGTLAGSLDALDRVALGVVDERQAGPVPQLGVRPALDDRGDESAGVRPELLGPGDQPLRRPSSVLAVRLGSVGLVGDVGPLGAVAAVVAGHAMAVEQQLDRRDRGADPDLGADQGTRSAVVARVVLHV